MDQHLLHSKAMAEDSAQAQLSFIPIYLHRYSLLVLALTHLSECLLN